MKSLGLPFGVAFLPMQVRVLVNLDPHTDDVRALTSKLKVALFKLLFPFDREGGAGLASTEFFGYLNQFVRTSANPYEGFRAIPFVSKRSLARSR